MEPGPSGKPRKKCLECKGAIEGQGKMYCSRKCYAAAQRIEICTAGECGRPTRRSSRFCRAHARRYERGLRGPDFLKPIGPRNPEPARRCASCGKRMQPHNVLDRCAACYSEVRSCKLCGTDFTINSRQLGKLFCSRSCQRRGSLLVSSAG